MQNAYGHLIEKLQTFTQKYYKNLLIRGFILCFSALAIAFVSLSVLEYFGRFSIVVRTFIFWSFIGLASFVLIVWIVRPLLQLIKLSKRISEQEAALIIGKHFPEVADKLLNVIQLKQQNHPNIKLLEASIEQKSLTLEPIPFARAVSFSENKRYLKYSLAPLILVTALFAGNKKEVITESGSRLLNYQTEYIPPAPFEFEFLNKSLEVVQHQDYILKVKLKGEKIPTEAFLELNNLMIKMKAKGEHVFEYRFNNIQNSVIFKCNAGGLYSTEEEIRVIKAPSLNTFTVDLNYPLYTQQKNERLDNQGNLFVPEGTIIDWSFSTEHSTGLKMLWGEEIAELETTQNNIYAIQKRVYNSASYTLLPYNNNIENTDSASYKIQVVKDAFPTVDVIESKDSTQIHQRYFQGRIKDDYGFTKFQFRIRNINNGWDSIVPVQIAKAVSTESFFFIFDLSPIQLDPDDSIEYMFEVFDNDGVNGAKKSQSKSFEFKRPSEEELQQMQAEKTDALKKELKENIDLAKELQDEFKELQKKLLDKSDLSWEDKQNVNELIEKQKKLERNIDQIAEKNKEKNAQMNAFSEQDKRIMDKQKQLQELMDELMTDEMRSLFDELEKLQDEMMSKEWMEKLEELQMNNEDLEKELDRNLEMLKKFEFEEALEENIEGLEELKQKQEALKQANDDKSKSQEQISEEQKKLNEEFDRLSEKIDDLHEKNQALERQENLEDTSELQEQIKQDMQSSSENAENKKRKKTSKSQEQSLEKIDELQQKLQSAQKQSGEQGPSEDMDALRQILENLIDLSLEEEDLLESLSSINQNDPEYVSHIHLQNKLLDNSKILEDSLFALSKRQAQIKATINREMNAINSNMKKSLEHMAERETEKAVNRQQLVMTSANNLALLLSDVLTNMQQDMADKMPGEQQCDKPGNGNPKPGDIKKMQEQLKQQLEQMKKKGQKDGEGQDKKGDKGRNKDLAKMMGRQEAIRQQLEKIAEGVEEKENGNSDNVRDAIEKMEETEQDIVNDNITQETLNRQNEIIEHLLDAERAEQERDEEEKREAKEAQQIPHHIDEMLEKYKKNKQKQAELLRTIPPKLKPFYKDKVKEYFEKIDRP